MLTPVLSSLSLLSFGCAEAVRRCEADSEGETITRRDLQRRILELFTDC